jgi:hypothetical protein
VRDVTSPKSSATALRVIGWAMTALVGAGMVFDAAIKLLIIRPVVDASQQIGARLQLTGVARPPARCARPCPRRHRYRSASIA